MKKRRIYKTNILGSYELILTCSNKNITKYKK